MLLLVVAPGQISGKSPRKGEDPFPVDLPHDRRGN
jgi:hypothetical protein